MSLTADYLAECARDPGLLKFRMDHCQLERGPYADLHDDYQEDIFAKLHDDRYRRFWIQLPRGYAKSSVFGAWFMIEQLLFQPPGFRAIAAAGDKDQASLLTDFVSSYMRRSDALADIFTVERHRVICGDNELQVISSDAPTSLGLLADLFILDELAVWPDGSRHREFFNNLWSAADKRQGRVLVTTTAGHGTGWQKGLADLFKTMAEATSNETERRWFFHAPESPPLPSFLDEAERAAIGSALPEPTRRRLHENIWQLAGESAAFTPDEVEACFTLRGPSWTTALNPENTIYLGLDLAVRRDFASWAAVTVHEGAVKLVGLRTYKPHDGQDISFSQVERDLLEFSRRWPYVRIVADPWSAHGLLERLREEHGLSAEESPRTSAALQREAAVLLDLVRTGRLHLWPIHDHGDRNELSDELARAVIVEKSYGFKLDVPRRAGLGHGDRLQATAIACAAAEAEGLREAQVLPDDLDREEITAESIGIYLPERDANDAEDRGWTQIGSFDDLRRM